MLELDFNFKLVRYWVYGYRDGGIWFDNLEPTLVKKSQNPFAMSAGLFASLSLIRKYSTVLDLSRVLLMMLRISPQVFLMSCLYLLNNSW